MEIQAAMALILKSSNEKVRAIDRMQSHFGEAIYKNSENIENVKKDIKTVLHHMVQNEKMSLEEQHSYCSRDSWCKFW